MDDIVLISHKDLDGYCSGAIAYNELKCRHPKSEIITIEMDYDRQLPELSNKVKTVYMMDFSLDKEKFEYLIKKVGRKNIIWIDHHKSVIEKFPEYSDIYGYRTVEKCGALLTWEYFHPVVKNIVPPIVKYVDDWDRWQMKFGTDTINLYEYVSGLPTITDVKGRTWTYLLSRTEEDMEPLIKMGNELRERRYTELKKFVEDVGVPMYINFQDKQYRCLKVNTTYQSSTSVLGQMVYDELGYDIFWGYYDKMSDDGKHVRINKLRSVVVDVSQIASKKGGGGHKNAAGWHDVENVIVKDMTEFF